VSKYARDPIAEAAVYVSYEPLDDQRIERLRVVLASGEVAGFAQPTPLLEIAIESRFGDETGSSARQRVGGYAVVSQDGRQRVQVRRDACVYSVLRPYPGWEQFAAEAARWFDLLQYRELSLTAIGTRYINHLELPDSEPVERYLRTYPELSHDLPQVVYNQYARFELPYPDEQSGVLTIQEGYVRVQDGQEAVDRFLLDLDLRLNAKPGEALSSLLPKIHDDKNRAFEACITEEMRNLIR